MPETKNKTEEIFKMTRLGENVFQFKRGFKVGQLNYPFMPFLLGGGFFYFQGMIHSGFRFNFFSFLCVVFAIYWTLIIIRYNKNGVILDKDKGVISLSKYSWNYFKPAEFEEIQINEIMGTNQDVDTTTETKYVNGSGWETTSSHSYNIVLQGKFGSKRFMLKNQDDWNLFMTLLYGEG
jgi:hypothetical protein